MAFVLGEFIAVQSIPWMLVIILSGLSAIKIITKQQVSVFVVVFLFCLLGFLLTDYEIGIGNQSYAYEEKKIEATGKISKIVKNKFGFYVYLQDVRLEQMKLRQILVDTESAEGLKIGKTVKIFGDVEQFSTARNKGNFDERTYYMSLGIYLKVSAREIRIIDSDYDGIRHYLAGLRERMKEKLSQICHTKDIGIFKLLKDKHTIYEGILLGDKSDMDTELKELYSLSGISHVLAISGLHISIIGMFVYKLLRKRFSFVMGTVFSVIVVVGFGLLSGMAIASIRAIVMFGLKLMGEVLGRNYDYVTAISLAGMILLIGNPFVIYNAGFQMSFVAIISIVVVWKKVMYILQLEVKDEKKQRERKNIFCQIKTKIKKSLLFSLTITICMNPIVAYHYFTLPTYSFLINMVIVPLMSIVVISGVAGIGISYLGIGVARIALFPGCLILALYEKLCNVSLKLPFASMIVGQPPLSVVYIYYIFLFILLFLLENKRRNYLKKNKKKLTEIPKEGIAVKQYAENQNHGKDNRKFVVALLGVMLVLEMPLYCYYPIKRNFTDKNILMVDMLDVGQGDGMVIRTPDNRVITIDGGSTSVTSVGEYRIIPFLKAEGVGAIDYAIVSHTDEDHVNGLEEMIEKSAVGGVKIRNLVMPDCMSKDERYSELLKKAEDYNIKVLYIKKGDRLQFGKIYFRCLAPITNKSYENKNDSSTVLSLEYERFSMLFTGDISSQVEEELKNNIRSHYTFLKVAHHGSKYSTSEAFLSWINPDYSVISVGEYNLYGHPHQELIKRLETSGSNVLRTDKSGGITVKCDGEKMVVEKNIWR